MQLSSPSNSQILWFTGRSQINVSFFFISLERSEGLYNSRHHVNASVRMSARLIVESMRIGSLRVTNIVDCIIQHVLRTLQRFTVSLVKSNKLNCIYDLSGFLPVGIDCRDSGVRTIPLKKKNGTWFLKQHYWHS